MKFNKTRFFHNVTTDRYWPETIKWVLAGTEGVDINDPRAAPIGETRNHPITGLPGFDMWIPIYIQDPGFDISTISHVYEETPELYIDPLQGATMRSVQGDVISYAQMDVYSQDILPDTVEVTMQEYNDNFVSIF